MYVDRKDVGLAQLDAGLALWFRQYANEQPPQERLEYEIAETKAFVDRIGLWNARPFLSSPSLIAFRAAGAPNAETAFELNERRRSWRISLLGVSLASC